MWGTQTLNRFQCEDSIVPFVFLCSAIPTWHVHRLLCKQSFDKPARRDSHQFCIPWICCHSHPHPKVHWPNWKIFGNFSSKFSKLKQGLGVNNEVTRSRCVRVIGPGTTYVPATCMDYQFNNCQFLIKGSWWSNWLLTRTRQNILGCLVIIIYVYIIHIMMTSGRRITVCLKLKPD